MGDAMLANHKGSCRALNNKTLTTKCLGLGTGSTWTKWGKGGIPEINDAPRRQVLCSQVILHAAQTQNMCQQTSYQRDSDSYPNLNEGMTISVGVGSLLVSKAVWYGIGCGSPVLSSMQLGQAPP
jgi:hypothetical protein